MKWDRKIKRCITCDHWSGKRKLAAEGTCAEDFHLTNVGACLHPQSQTQDKENKATTDTCVLWERWKKLRV